LSTKLTPERPERGYHHGELRETLMDAALASIAAHGTEKLSLRALAREAGVSATAPYRHFPSKESLLAALAEEGFRELLGRFEAVAGEPHEDLESRLLAIGMAYIEFALENPTRYELMFGSVLADFSGYDALQEAATGCYLVLYQILEEGLSPDRTPKLTPTQLGSVVWAAVHGIASLLIYHRSKDALEHPRDPMTSLQMIRANPEAALRILFAGMR
jgi:AcrR family transcriptional regulator